MKLLTWNINGIRAINSGTSMKLLLDSLEADIICLQETKITRNLLTHDIANVKGYYAFFSCSKVKNGYSGVVTYCKENFCPVAVEEGLSGILVKDDQSLIGHNVIDTFPKETILSLDSEGRAIITEHKIENYDFHLTIINVYCPHVDVENVERYSYKLKFNQLLEARYNSLVMAGKHVIIVGDLNISHRRIDHCDPDDDFEKNKARIWFDDVIGVTQVLSVDYKDNMCYSSVKKKTIYNDTCCPSGSSESLNDFEETLIMVDIFRHFHPTAKDVFTCWDPKTRARETNYGTRIDYILSNEKFVPYIKSCRIRSEVMGSDHCPVQCVIGLTVSPSHVVPSLCTSLMPEFLGHQANITTYFTKKRLYDEGIELCFPLDAVKVPKQIGSYFQPTDKTDKTKMKRNRNVSGDNYNNRLHSDVLWNSSNYRTPSELNSKSKISKSAWKNILKGPETLPLCTGHREPSVIRTVKKTGPNLGRQFYVCSKPIGQASNKNSQCPYFHWKN